MRLRIDLELQKQVQKMRVDWNERARQNAWHYVATGREDWTAEEFFESGEETVRGFVLNDMQNICQGRDPKHMRVLEVGCGAGRVTRALAKVFGEVWAVDISPEMVRLARHALAGFGNVRALVNSGSDLQVVRRPWWERFRSLEFDFAFSTIVFQHIPSRQVIENYIFEVARLLRPGGLFKFQVQGAPGVSSSPGDTWIGVTFSEEEMRDIAERAGFEMRYAHGSGTQDFWLWFFRTQRPPLQ
jgi:SAM-dependent methyltransferase